VKTATVASDPKSSNKKSLGYGYVSFHSEEELQRCLKEMNNKMLQGKQIALSKQIEKNNFDPKANVFVRNLDKAVTQD